MVSLTLYVGWRFLHSEKFSEKASRDVSKILTEKAGVKLNFTGISFKLFPLSTNFKNVKITKDFPDQGNIDLNVEDVTVIFTYSSFLSSNLEIEKLIVESGKVSIFHKESKDPFDYKSLNTKKMFILYQELLNKSPIKINILELKEIGLQINKAEMTVNKFVIAPMRLNIRSKMNLSNMLIRHGNKNYPEKVFNEFESSIELSKNQWSILNLNLQRDYLTFSSSGKLLNDKSGNLTVETEGQVSGDVEKNTALFPQLNKELKLISAQVSGKYKTNGPLNNINIVAEVDNKLVKTPWIDLDHVKGKIYKSGSLLLISDVSASRGLEKYKTTKKESFFDLKNEKFTNFKFLLHIENAETNTFLKSIKDVLGVVKGKVSGSILINLFDNKAVFNLISKTVIRKFSLTNEAGTKNILVNEGFVVERGEVVINQDYRVDLDARLTMPNSQLNAKGSITDNKIDINVANSTIDLQHFGPIAGVKLNGRGPFNLKIYGPPKNVNFVFDVNWDRFNVFDLNLGKVKSKFLFDLNELEIAISELAGEFNKSNFEASGRFGFAEKNSGMDVQVNFEKTNFTDTRTMMNLIFKNIKLPVIPEFDFAANYRIRGGFDVANLQVDGEINGSDLRVYNEEAEKISLRFNLKNNLLNFRNIKISKARGMVNANANVNLKSNFLDLTGEMSGLRLKDFNFYRNLNLEYDGDLYVDFDGNGPLDDFSSKFKAKLSNAFIGNVPASSSSAVFYLNTNNIITNANLLAGKIKIDSLLSFDSGIAAIKANIESYDMRELLGAISSHNINDKQLKGRIKAQLNTQISTGKEGIRKFYLELDEFIISKEEFNFMVDPNFNKIQVDEGIVRNWDLRFRDGKEYLNVKGTNIQNGYIRVDHQFSLKTSLLELIFNQIEKATGNVSGNASVVLAKEATISDFNMIGDNQSFKIKSIPGYISNLSYNLTKKGEYYEVLRFNGKYGEGDLKIGGRFMFDDQYPQINLNYQLERSTIPLFKRSNVLVNSAGTLTGTTLPYKLNGKVTFMHGEILDDPQELMAQNNVTTDEYKKFLPTNNNLANRRIIEMSLAFETANPIMVKNNLAEIYVKGTGLATGDILSPELNTRLETVPLMSKFKFKGHDFALSQGYVEIRDRGKNRLSEIKFVGTSKINEYDMKLDLSGSISNVNIDLSSEPVLSKEDLLSLLTLGYTSDISKNLEAAERRFVTTVGIGTLLVDQLKINEDLNSTLGLKLSVQPEFKEDDSSFVQGKAAISDGVSSRLKSATKIKVNKKINNKVDVSLSSTVGGSLEQKQEMNINLNINKYFTLEGVYELKPTEDESTDTPSSVGADIKWRTSF